MMRRSRLLLLASPFVAWSLFRLAQGHARWDYVAFLVVPPALALATPATKRLFVGIYPLGVVALLYDAMQLVRDVGISAERVHVCDLRQLEIALFGVTVDGRRTTVHDWLQAHSTPALDLLFAVPYGTFLFAYIATGLFLWRRSHRALVRFAWCFLILNVGGLLTHHLYPAAPPWYFHAHGCEVDVGAAASEGPNLARVDAWIGVPYFRGMYGRASEVFGAMPSLHVAYPLVIMLEGWPWLGALGRAGTVAFFGTMCVAAVYLDHHWVVDVVVGLAYGLGSIAIVRRIWPAVRGGVGVTTEGLARS